MPQQGWQFAIDVGGTFCDVVARSPVGETVTFKLLSSGRTKGVAAAGTGRSAIVDPQRGCDPDGFWDGFGCALLDPLGRILHQTRVVHFYAASGTLSFETPVPFDLHPSTSYELFSDDPAPIVAIRYLMNLRLG